MVHTELFRDRFVFLPIDALLLSYSSLLPVIAFSFPTSCSLIAVSCSLPPSSSCLLLTFLLATCYMSPAIFFPVPSVLFPCFLPTVSSVLFPCVLLPASCSLMPVWFSADCCITVSTVNFINSHFSLWQAQGFGHIEILFDFLAAFPRPRMYLKSLCDKVAGTGSMAGGSIRSMIREIMDAVHRRGFSSIHLLHFWLETPSKRAAVSRRVILILFKSTMKPF